MAGMMSVELDEHLCYLMRMARTRHGWRQEDVAAKIGKSVVWYRQIEGMKVPSASLEVVCDICETLGIGRSLLAAYPQLSEGLKARAQLASPSVEAEIRAIRGITEDEGKILVDTLRQLRKMRKDMDAKTHRSVRA
jgi:transcriptional regulator with XRE-family HTH domain